MCVYIYIARLHFQGPVLNGPAACGRKGCPFSPGRKACLCETVPGQKSGRQKAAGAQSAHGGSAARLDPQRLSNAHTEHSSRPHLGRNWPSGR